MGNPHAIFWVADAARLRSGPPRPDPQDGPCLSAARQYFAARRLSPPDHVLLHVWERGAGLTRACGSAACATLVAAARMGLTGRKATVTLPGGDLGIAWREADDHVLMTGPVEWEHAGVLSAAVLAGRRLMPVEIVTFGCRLNIAELEAMQRHAEAAGGLNDVVIVNTLRGHGGSLPTGAPVGPPDRAREPGAAIICHRLRRPD